MLDLKKIVKNIRTMKTLLKHSLLTPMVRKKIESIQNHIINIEGSQELSEYDDSVFNDVVESQVELSASPTVGS